MLVVHFEVVVHFGMVVVHFEATDAHFAEVVVHYGKLVGYFAMVIVDLKWVVDYFGLLGYYGWLDYFEKLGGHFEGVVAHFGKLNVARFGRRVVCCEISVQRYQEILLEKFDGIWVWGGLEEHPLHYCSYYSSKLIYRLSNAIHIVVPISNVRIK